MMKSSLANSQTKSTLNDEEVFKEYAKAYNEKIAFAISWADLAKLNNREYETCINVGNKLYGANK